MASEHKRRVEDESQEEAADTRKKSRLTEEQVLESNAELEEPKEQEPSPVLAAEEQEQEVKTDKEPSTEENQPKPKSSSFASGFFKTGEKPTGPGIFGQKPSTLSGVSSTSTTQGSIFGTPSGKSIFGALSSAGDTQSSIFAKPKDVTPKQEDKDKADGSENGSSDEGNNGGHDKGSDNKASLAVPRIGEGEKEVSKFEQQEIKTGEEGEHSIFSCRAKLYVMDLTNSKDGWKERGTGTLRLNCDTESKKPRLVMRSDGALRVILNQALVKGRTEIFKGMPSSLASEKFTRLNGIEDSKPHQYALKTNQDNAKQLYEAMSKQLADAGDS